MGDRIEIGYVARAHGVRGELRVVLHNPASEILLDADAVYVGDERLEVTGAREVPGAWLVKLAGVDDRTKAEALRGSTVAVDRDAIELEEGEVLEVDLIGCKAVLEDGTPYGQVDRIEVGPLQDRLVIRDGDVERELPIVDELIVDVRLDERIVVVAPPEGLPETRRRGR